MKLLEFFINMLTNSLDMTLEPAEIDDSELAEYNLIPDTVQSSGKVRGCLQESDDLIIPGAADQLG